MQKLSKPSSEMICRILPRRRPGLVFMTLVNSFYLDIILTVVKRGLWTGSDSGTLYKLSENRRRKEHMMASKEFMFLATGEEGLLTGERDRLKIYPQSFADYKNYIHQVGFNYRNGLVQHYNPSVQREVAAAFETWLLGPARKALKDYKG